MDQETLNHLATVEKVVDGAKAQLSGREYPDTLRTVILAGSIDQMFEHHETVILAIRNGKIGSAFALARIIFESMYRGLWLNFIATDAEVEAFERTDKFPLNVGEMAGQIDEKYRGEGYFAELKRRAWPALNSYTHTGMLQLGRRFTGHKVQPSYTDAEIVEITTAVTTCILLLVAKFLAVQGYSEACRKVEAMLGKYGRAAGN